MIDARNVYRKVTRKICDFSPEQLKNLTSIVWLYRGEKERFLKLVEEHLATAVSEAGLTTEPLNIFISTLTSLVEKVMPFLYTLPKDAPHAETLAELKEARSIFEKDAVAFRKGVEKAAAAWKTAERDNAGLHKAAERFSPIAEQSRDLVKQADLIYKLAARLIDFCEKDLNAKDSDEWNSRETTKLRKALDEARKAAVEQLKQVRYFFKQAHWLQERFPEAELRDVEGLVKLVDKKELEANDWSLTPGRYVGVAPEEVDEEFDFEEALRGIHLELQDLNAEASELAAKIARNFEELM